MRALFDRVAQPILQPGTGQGWFGPWRVMALDGVMLDVPDTADNVERFGRSGNAVADSPFPQARVAALAECGSRAVVAAEIGECHTGERELAWGFLDRIDEQMLVLADRGFYSYEFWQQVRARDAQLLWRIQTQINLPVDQQLPDGSYLSALVPKSMRSAIAGGKKRRLDRYQIPVRVVDYTITNLMHEAADQTGAEPDRISFMRSLRIIRRQVTDQAAFSPQQTRHNNHHRDR
jgi:hypothetical protein